VAGSRECKEQENRKKLSERGKEPLDSEEKGAQTKEGSGPASLGAGTKGRRSWQTAWAGGKLRRKNRVRILRPGAGRGEERKEGSDRSMRRVRVGTGGSKEAQTKKSGRGEEKGH